MQVSDALTLLGIEAVDLSSALTANEARDLIAKWKVEVLKPACREAAKAWHPDLGPPEEEEGRNAMLVELNRAKALLESLEVSATMNFFGVPIRVL